MELSALSPDQLKEFVRGIVDDRLRELLGDPDLGLQLGEDLRARLIAAIAEYRDDQAQLQVGDFDRETFDASVPFFARIGGGSIGGKARGLAFVRRLVGLHGVNRRFPGVQVDRKSVV